jgi:hypothetical protein
VRKVTCSLPTAGFPRVASIISVPMFYTQEKLLADVLDFETYSVNFAKNLFHALR